MLQNLYFFEKGGVKQEINQNPSPPPVTDPAPRLQDGAVPVPDPAPDPAPHQPDTQPPKKNTYYSVPEGDIDDAEKNIIELKNSQIFKEKNEPTMKYLLFLLKTENFYYSKMIYHSSKMRNVDIPINYKISNVRFMTVEYVTPSLKTPLIIDLSSFKFAVGSNILNYTFIYWYLRNQYGNWVESVFDFKYKIHIIDSEFNIVELLPFNYLYLKENEYEVCRIYTLI